MVSQITKPCSLTLPPEVWRIVLHIIGNEHEDLLFLLKTAQYISSFFRREVEEFYIANVLPHLSISLDITSIKHEQRSRWGSSISFQDVVVQAFFSRSSHDRTKAIFNSHDDRSGNILRQLDSRTASDLPKPDIQVRMRLKNTALPNPTISTVNNSGEVEIDWKAYMPAFFSEQRYYYQQYRHQVGVITPPRRTFEVIITSGGQAN